MPESCSARRHPGNGSGHIDNVYTLACPSIVADGIEFDWDAANTKHLAAHKVMAREFESVCGIPHWIWRTRGGGEERYRSVGLTDSGRLRVVIWTLRDGKVRAVTAFPAGATYRSWRCVRAGGHRLSASLARELGEGEFSSLDHAPGSADPELATDREDDRDGPDGDNEGKHCVTIAAGSNLFTCGLIDGLNYRGLSAPRPNPRFIFVG